MIPPRNVGSIYGMVFGCTLSVSGLVVSSVLLLAVVVVGASDLPDILLSGSYLDIDWLLISYIDREDLYFVFVGFGSSFLCAAVGCCGGRSIRLAGYLTLRSMSVHILTLVQ